MDNIKKLQETELEILREFDAICRKNNISYIVEGGTLLGAVRHNGFIPWDDDIDVKMLRSEYERFCEVCEKSLDKRRYFLQTYKSDKNYLWGYARILRQGTLFMRKDQEHLKMKRGIFIDIFPVDGMPSQPLAKMIYNFTAFLCRKVLYARVGVKNEKKIFYKFLYFILNFVPKSAAHKGFEILSKIYIHKKTDLLRCLSWNDKAESSGYRREWFENTMDIKFENLSVKAPKDTQGFLTYVFGADYMTLPPVEERIPRHTATQIRFSEN